MNCRILKLNAGVILGLMRDTGHAVPPDAAAVGAPAMLGNDEIGLLIKSHYFAPTPEGQAYPAVDFFPRLRSDRGQV